MNKFKDGLNKTAKFLRKNIYYVLIIVAVAAIATVLGVTLSRDKVNTDVPVVVTPDEQDKPGGDDKPDDVKPAPVIFVTPVSGGAVSQSYSDTEFVFSKTLEQWSTHLAIDYAADEGTAVLAAYDGTVTAIDNDELYGYCITISHDDGLVTKYYGLTENIKVAVSQKVKSSMQIGEVGSTMLIECMDGPHLHFETLKNGVLINPQKYFITEDK